MYAILFSKNSAKLLTDTEFFDDRTVTLDVFALQVIQHTTTLSYQCGQRALW